MNTWPEEQRLASRVASPSSTPVPAVRPKRPLSWRRVACAVGEACRGVAGAWRTEPNLRLHAYAGGIVVAGGIALRFSQGEWLAITLAIGLVIFAELMNTAIERTVDLAIGLSPEPAARHVKDLAAGCVLVTVVIATVTGLLVLVPRLAACLRAFR